MEGRRHDALPCISAATSCAFVSEAAPSACRSAPCRRTPARSTAVRTGSTSRPERWRRTDCRAGKPRWTLRRSSCSSSLSHRWTTLPLHQQLLQRSGRRPVLRCRCRCSRPSRLRSSPVGRPGLRRHCPAVGSGSRRGWIDAGSGFRRETTGVDPGSRRGWIDADPGSHCGCPGPAPICSVSTPVRPGRHPIPAQHDHRLGRCCVATCFRSRRGPASR